MLVDRVYSFVGYSKNTQGDDLRSSADFFVVVDFGFWVSYGIWYKGITY